MQKFTLQKREYDLKLGWYLAMEVLPEKFGISIAKLLSDMSETQEVINILFLDDEKVVSLMWFFISEQTDSLTYEDFLKNLETADVTKFREAFWQEILSFSGPLKQPMLTDMWNLARRDLKNVRLEELVSSSAREESTSTTSPSEK